MSLDQCGITSWSEHYEEPLIFVITTGVEPVNFPIASEL